MKSKGQVIQEVCQALLSGDNKAASIIAQNEYPFMFGKPDTFSEFIYHISGSTYLENINSGTQNIIGLRIPYFLKLTILQLFVLLPFFIRIP